MGAELTFHPVDGRRWADLEALFEGKGGPNYCWCMAWRARGKAASEMDAADRKVALRAMVAAGTPIGLLGYAGGEPVAWCSVAPRPTYRPLGGLEVEGEDEGRVWAIACFFLRRDHRGQGTFHAMLRAAVAHARKQGATAIEAYPVDPSSPSYRFMGFVPAFAEAGFEEVGRAGSRRHVMRLAGGKR